MTEYIHERKTAEKYSAIEIPDEAVGITLDTFSDRVIANYLVPEEAHDAE